MAELRKDYILDRYVIVSSSRGKRPHEFKQESRKADKKDKCFFCPGNEELTPPEIGRIGTKNRWRIRWFPNKFAAVESRGDPEIKIHNNFYTFASAYGYHEVIVETDNHEKQLSDLSKKQIKDLLTVYANRIEELSRKDNISYVCIFKNFGRESGTSIVHSHSQVIAYNKWPALVKDKIDAVKRYDHCPYCDIISSEKDSERRCFDNRNFIAFAPYASRFHFEIWVFPLKHVRNITEMDDQMLSDLAGILKKILKKLSSLNTPYNMQLFYSPEAEDLHFHIEICPRLAIWGGFELLTGDTINSVSPEEAAGFYRGKKRLK